VQTRIRFGAPATTARTFWMFGSQRRFVRRWEWLTRMPTWGRFPQTSQTADIWNLTSEMRKQTRVAENSSADTLGRQWPRPCAI
jgi:hypothetical protein